MSEDKKDDDEPSGNGAIFGVLFAVGLTIGAIFLMSRMQQAAALLDCAFTHSPKCRELIDDK